MQKSALGLETPNEVARSLAQRARELRLLKGWTRNTLAHRAGVSSASLKRFETTGQGSFELILKLALALSRLDELNSLFLPPKAQSIDELERRLESKARKRGRI